MPDEAAADAAQPPTVTSRSASSQPIPPPARKRSVDARRRKSPRSMRLVAAGSVIALLATVVPLFVISAYNHSYADDWHYAVPVHQALEATGGNPIAALGAAFMQVGNTYIGWQGTYTAIFLMSLEPGVFSEDLYVIVAPIILVTLIICTFWACHVALVEWLGCDRPTWVSVSCLILILQVLFQPSPVEGIFWYNSAIYYTFFHSWTLVLFGMILRMIDPRRTKPTRALVICATILSALVAGGNFVTVLAATEGITLLLFCLLVKRRPSAMRVFPVFLTMFVGAVVSMVAPGNSVRQNTQFPENALDPFQTVLKSCIATFQYLSSWTTGLMVLGVLAIAVLLARCAFSSSAVRWRFQLPGLVSVFSVAWLATSFTPTFFSMGTVGPGRVQNVRLDFYVILIVANLAWWLGWAACKVRERRVSDARQVRQLVLANLPQVDEPAARPQADVAPSSDASAAEKPSPRPALPRTPAIGSRTVAAIVGVIALVACMTIASLSTDAKLVDTLTTTSAVKSLATGQAASYDQQVRDRLRTIESSTDDSLEVPFYTNAPKVLFMGDIRDNMNNYINFRLAQWYGKTSIIGVQGG